MKDRQTSPSALLRLMQRELRNSRGALPGGILWSFIEPLLTVLLLIAGFSWVLRTPPLGHSYALFFASGFGVFLVFQNTAQAVGNGFAHLKRKGRRWWPEALMARGLVNGSIAVVVAVSLALGVIVFVEHPPMINYARISLAMCFSGLLGAAVGLLNCAMFHILPIWRPIWGITSRVLFLGSGVLFLPETLPHPVQGYFQINPLVHVLGILREGFYTGYQSPYSDATFVALTGLSVTALGLALLFFTHPVPCAARRRISA